MSERGLPTGERALLTVQPLFSGVGPAPSTAVPHRASREAFFCSRKGKGRTGYSSLPPVLEPMSRSSLVIFDCDGVLVDSEPLQIQALLDVAAPLGFSMALVAAVERFRGAKMADVVAAVERQMAEMEVSTVLPQLTAQVVAGGLLDIPSPAPLLEATEVYMEVVEVHVIMYRQVPSVPPAPVLLV